MLKKIVPAFLVLMFSTISCGILNNVYNAPSEDIAESSKMHINEHEKMQAYVKNAPKTIENYLQILEKHGYGMHDISKKSNKEFTKVPLLDGDYVIGNKGAEYFAEYDKHGDLMGCVKQELVEVGDNKFTQVLYEYRIQDVYNSLEMKMELKHVLIVSYDANTKKASQYIYSADGELLCSKIGDDLYVSETARNMIPNWKNKIDYTDDAITVFTYEPTPGAPVIIYKRDTLPRRALKELMSPFISVGAVAFFLILPLYMTESLPEEFFYPFLIPFAYFETFDKDIYIN